MSRPLPPSTPSDWQASLLEAIQQRDSPRALALAQRCVHRQGMGSLTALLDRAEAAAGGEGEPRAWLLHLLRVGVAEPEPEPEAKAKADLPSSKVQPPSGSGIPLTSTVPDSHSPEAPLHHEREPQPTVEPQSKVEPQPKVESQPMPDRQRVASSAQLVADPAPLLGSPAAVSPTPAPAAPSPIQTLKTSSALDQAFAPLEIAFPPLPMVDRREVAPASAAPAPAAPPPLEVPSLLMPPARESFTPPGPREAAPPDSPASPLGDDGNGGELDEGREDGELNLDDGPPRGDFEVAAAAAPVPSFHVDGPPDRPPVPSRASLPPEDSATTDAPVAKSLAAWRAWLPGAFRSRPRT